MTPDKTNTQQEAERRDFESWYKTTGFTEWVTERCWDAWQARAALSHAPPDPSPEVVKLVDDLIERAREFQMYHCAWDMRKKMDAAKAALLAEFTRLSAPRPAPSPKGAKTAEYMKEEFLDATWGHMGCYLGCTTGDCLHHDRAECEKAVRATAREMAEEYLKGPAPTPSETLTAPATLMERIAAYLEDAECECDKSTGHTCDRCQLIKAIAAPKGTEPPARPLVWTKEKPKAGGFYWLGSPDSTNETSIYEIRILADGSPVWAVQIGLNESDPGSWQWERVNPKVTHWAGPIPAPTEPPPLPDTLEGK